VSSLLELVNKVGVFLSSSTSSTSGTRHSPTAGAPVRRVSSCRQS